MACVTLAYDDRRRRRLRLSTDAGEEFLLDLAEAAVLPDGAGLRLDDGAWIAVSAAREPLAGVTCHDPGHLARIAWHLGNRHLPTEVAPDALYIRRDHVIEEMLRGLGAEVGHLDRPFNPEGGAYGGHPTQDHDHDHGHGHGHDHGPDPRQEHAHAHGTGPAGAGDTGE